MIFLVDHISRILGRLEVLTRQLPPSPQLRKKNLIKTIKSTLAIEGHPFTEEQVTAIIEQKRVVGTKKEILEVQNATQLYDSIDKFKSHLIKDFLLAHKVLMKNVIYSAGKYRSKNVGILEGKKIRHIAPQAVKVPQLMNQLFKWYKKEKELHPLILSSIVHYEIEFIHPFEDGNGRIGRFWQGLILTEYNSLFKYVPVESLIEKNQSKYYLALKESDKAGESTLFIKFMLNTIHATLKDVFHNLIDIKDSYQTRIERAFHFFSKTQFTRKDYIKLFKNISSATASRDLSQGVHDKKLKKYFQKNQTKYQFNNHT